MPTPAPTAEPTHTPDPADDDVRFRHILDIILDTGATLIQELAADPTLSADAKAEPHERLARTLRRTIALARHIAEAPTKRAAHADRRAQSRRQVIREVEDAIVKHADRPERSEPLRDELNERLGDPEFEHDLATRPIEDIIRDLMRDLGLAGGHDPRPRRTPDHIRDLNARAAAPSRPPDAQPEPDHPEYHYEPGHTRSNALLDRYREAADG